MTAIVGVSLAIGTRNRSARTPASITVTRSRDAQTKLVTEGRPKTPTRVESCRSADARFLPAMITCCKYSGVATEYASHAPVIWHGSMIGQMGNHSRSYLTCLKSDAIATRKYQNGSTVAAYSPIYGKTDDHWLFTLLSIRCTSTPGQQRNAAWSLCKTIDNTGFVTVTRIKN